MVTILSLIGLCSLGGFVFPGETGQSLSAAHSFILNGNDDEVATISLEIQFGQSKKKLINKIPFKKGMTVLDAMKYAQKNKKLSFKYRGKNDTAFLTSIDKIKNQGGRGDNWIFRVNKKLGNKSFGISKLNSGDKVTWTFGKYKP